MLLYKLKYYMRNAFCLIVHYPRKSWMEFLSTFVYYDVYMIVDDNSQNYQELYGKKYPNIWFIQIDNDDYKNSHFIDDDFPKETISGWHKALYYFSILNITFDNVWFFEDDVFLYKESTLFQIDLQYPSSDLISASLEANFEGLTTDWHWYKITVNYPAPWYKGMMCAVRLSAHLLKYIREYADKNKSLFFIEAMFPTIAKHHNLICVSPDELQHIYYRHEFNLIDIKKTHLYHPMKEFDLHELLRTRMAKNTR